MEKKWIPRETGCGKVAQWQPLLDTVMNLRVP